MHCHICDHDASFFTMARIANRYDARYFKCDFCSHVQTEKPYWLDKTYSKPINKSDIGLASRNISLARKVRVIIWFLFNRNKRFLDYAGGYGLFVRLMRDYGLDFYRYDKFCSNLFAQGFDADEKGITPYEMATAFEVFEHFEKPLEEIDQILTFSRNVLFTTELLPISIPKPGEWWYYGLDHGQHISFYSLRSLEIIAEKNGLNLFTDGRSLHLLTEKKLSSFLFFILTRTSIDSLISMFLRPKSLLESDFSKMIM